MQTQMQDREVSEPDLLRHSSCEITGRAQSVNMAPALSPLSLEEEEKKGDGTVVSVTGV